jgi:stage V sporulation protein R
MELISQQTKRIMEGCKQRALDAGLSFQSETLEYIVTNRDLIDLTPRMMIPTLYDFWVHDVEVLKEQGKYELYPSNPYETVINTRPAISYYNDNNPDWLNVMIFYHVLAHIDFFQNNASFRHTWDYDFAGRALADKRMIAALRAEKGRWVDYVIEFTRGIDNLVGYHALLSQASLEGTNCLSKRVNYYFDVFLQRSGNNAPTTQYLKEVDRYNQCLQQSRGMAEDLFFSTVREKHPEFEALFEKHRQKGGSPAEDLIQYLAHHSPFLNREENEWMKAVMEVIRTTSLFFQPQIRTRIMNEGWASFWHEALFIRDDRISGHEVDFARTNAKVTAMPRVGLNPYALGLRLFRHIREMGDRGRHSLAFRQLTGRRQRERYAAMGDGRKLMMAVRENYTDFTFVQAFIDQEFVDRHRLFVAGKRLNRKKNVWQYYVKSRSADRYREMVTEQLYHPPRITIEKPQDGNGCLYLKHHLEGKPLVSGYIANCLMGIGFLWGGPVKLETWEVAAQPQRTTGVYTPGAISPSMEDAAATPAWQRVLYTMQNRQLKRQILES